MAPSNDALWERVFEFAPEALAVVDGTGCLALVNRKAEALFGYARGELLGRPLESLAPEHLRETFAELRSCGRAPPGRPPPPRRDLAGLRADGSAFPLEVTLAPVEVGDRTVLVFAFRDVSEQRRAQEELQ